MSEMKEKTVSIYESNINEFFSLSEGVLNKPEKRGSEKLSFLFELPSGIHTIGDNCFSDYDEIESITLAKDAAVIGKTITGRCVKDVKLGKNVREIHPRAFDASPELSVISVKSGNLCFSSILGMLMSKDESTLIFAPQLSIGRTAIDTLDLESGFGSSAKDRVNAFIANKLRKKVRSALVKVTRIGDYAMAIFPEKYPEGFENYRIDWALDLKWHEGLREIGDFSFKACFYYRSLSFSEGLERIGDGAFSACSKLEEISLPQSVVRIGSYSFFKCGKLRRLMLPDRLDRIGKGLCRDCTSLSEIVLPSSCTCIEDEAFSGCTSLESVTIPDTVKTIGSKAFMGCEGLDIVVPSSAEYCEDSFSGCRSVSFR